MSYKVEPMTSIPTTKVRRDAIYPFAELQIGQCFRVPAEKRATFNSVRTCAYRYSQRKGILIHCTVDANGDLVVWRDDPANVQYVSPLPVGTKDKSNAIIETKKQQGPTKQQWLAHLQSMDQQQQFVMGPEYKHLFSELRDWTPAGFTAFELKPGELTVTRQSEKG